MTLKLYNTKSGRLEYFQPLNPDRVTLYACGPTVYDHAHVGHARAAVAFDILVRHLKASGFQVAYARNFTDVDDKIIRRSAEKNMPWLELAETFIDSFRQDMAAIGCLEPDYCPRATEYIEQMIEDISEIIKAGFAYEVEGDVYFDVPSWRAYGELSHRDPREHLAGARVSVDERKKDAADFALWKAAKPGEPSWPSPWGLGRPGWHIECSTMSQRLLGAEFDIHGGGQDLIFPHHENELAQSGALGRPMARFWCHNGFVRFNNEKMSKSLGNFFTVKDVLQNFDGEVLRFLLLSKHYRGPLDFSDEALKEAEKALERVYRALEAAEELMGDEEALAFKLDLVKQYREKFTEALDNDLNTAQALGVVFDLVRLLNKAAAAGDREQSAAAYAALKIFGEELNLWQRPPAEFFAALGPGRGEGLEPAEIERQIELRAEARKAKNWAEADRIRAFLAERGVVLEDKPGGGTVWKYQG